jgi:predicted DCC family thiol-disulfide oxidoreductase YuxK
VIDHPIIFFDSACGVCNRFVESIIRADNAAIFRFAPLQGNTARMLLPPLAEDWRGWSIVYIDERGIHERSNAVLEVYRRLGRLTWLISLVQLLPLTIRDPIYQFVAGRRYLWRVQRSCQVAAADWSGRFLP